MITVPQTEMGNDGTESKPIVLSGDQVESWELFFSAIYRRYALTEPKVRY